MSNSWLLLSLLATSTLAADLTPLPNFSQTSASLEISSLAVTGRPWTVAGEHGALFGRQNGKFEAWLWPVKILSDFRISAELSEYPVPIDVNALAAGITVTPAETTITYSHAAFTIRQHMFAPRGPNPHPANASVFFEIQSVRPLELTFSFTPDMLRMWPAPNFGRPNGEWVAQGESGVYILHTDKADFNAIVAMPHTRPGIMVPYQEHPQTFPLQLKLSFDPKRDTGSVFPLIFALSSGKDASSQAASINGTIPKLYAETQEYYSHFFDHRLTAETPDHRVNEALRWAEIAIDQAQVRYHGETGLVAGYYESADSARPGYAWFFGRDTLFTSYAINSYGDFAFTKRALDFLIARQRSDGKIMHEFSQAADQVDWKSTPYFYASADATPLFVMAMWDYARTSADTKYLRSNWAAVRKAYDFTRAHASDNGIYTNAEGTGWVESWPPGMPHQEIYLAAVDQQSCHAMSQLAALMNETALADAARRQAATIASKIESEFYESRADFYAFSRNPDGSLDHTATIYPSLAWWDGTWSLKNGAKMLTRWASQEFSTDWGTRDISPQTSFYDPISYHQGSIWPLFTGWVSVAEYRAQRPLSGYAHLMQNANLTWAQDLGSVTELLSGEFFQPLGRSSSHQLWSSAMIIVPMLRGLFGLDWDALNHTLHVAPQLPGDWDHALLQNVYIGSSVLQLEYQRAAAQLTVRAKTEKPEVLCLTAQVPSATPCQADSATEHILTLPLPPVELSIPASLPAEGSITTQLKVLDQSITEHRAVFTFAAPGATTWNLPLRLNRAHITAKGATVNRGTLHIRFPDVTGYQRQQVSFTW